MTALASHLSAFLNERLPHERNASENTRASYAYAFQLLVQFASQRCKVQPSALSLEQIEARLVLDFLAHLETVRKNGPSSRNARLAQDIVAVVCLRTENEISFDSLLEDLVRSLSFPIDSDHVLQNLQHSRRGGLVSIDWHRRAIKREGPLKDYVTNRVIANEMWSLIFDDWLKINRSIENRYGKVNTEYFELLSPKQQQ